MRLRSLALPPEYERGSYKRASCKAATIQSARAPKLPRVSERLDRVAIAYSRGTVEIPWDSRDALLERLRHLDSAEGIRNEFVAVGASRAVQLNRSEVILLTKSIDAWTASAGGRQNLPTGIAELWEALWQDIRDTSAENARPLDARDA